MGITGNDRAATLAKEASTLDTINHHTPLPVSQVKISIKHWALNQSTALLRSTPSSNRLHPLIVSLNTMESKSILKSVNRSDLHKLTNILANRAPLIAFLFRAKLSTTDLCPRCFFESEDNVHFLCHCPFFHRLRTEYFGFPAVCISDLFNIKIFKILSFIKASNVFKRE